MRVKTKLNLTASYLNFTIFLSFIGGYFAELNRGVYYATSFIIVFLALFYAAFYLNQKYFTIKKPLFWLISVLATILLISIVINLKINLHYLFIFFFLSSIYNVKQNQFGDDAFLNVINKTYLVYLILSTLLYVGIIPKPIEELNQFQFQFGGFTFHTFIGLFGSTSHIDSYSVIVFLVNILLGTQRNRWVIVLSLLATILTLRSTPLLMMLVGLLTYAFRNSKVFGGLLLGGLVLSFLIPSLIHWMFKSDIVDLLIDFSLTGRGLLWREMLSDYSTRGVINQVFGFGDSSSFLMKTWNHETDNPHNVFFAILINYGLLVFLLLVTSIAYFFLSIGFKRRIILFAIFAAGMGNSNIFSFSHIPMVFVFIYLIYKDQHEPYSQYESSNKTN